MATDSSVLSVYDGSWVTTLPVAELNGHLARAAVVFLPSCSRGDAFRVLPSEGSDGFTFRELPFPELPGTLGLRGPRFLDLPLAGSPGSGAQYLVVHPTPDRGIGMLELVQYLPPHAVTSIHYHEIEDEWFLPLWGACTMRTGQCAAAQRERDLVKQARLERETLLLPTPFAAEYNIGKKRDREKATDALYVPPRVVHQLVTGELPALNLLRIRRTDARTLPALDHRYCAWTNA